MWFAIRYRTGRLRLFIAFIHSEMSSGFVKEGWLLKRVRGWYKEMKLWIGIERCPKRKAKDEVS